MVNCNNKIRLTVIAVTAVLLAVNSSILLSDIDGIQKLVAEGKLQAALDQTNRELENDGENVSYQFMRGLILTRMEKLEEARDVFTHITETNPELPEPYNNLAVIYASLGDYDKAKELLEKAIHTHPAYATAHENIGDIYAKLASQAYNQALELDKENNSARAKLSLVNELFSLPSTDDQVVLASSREKKDETSRQQPPVEEPIPAPPVRPNPVSLSASTAPATDVEMDEIRAKEQELVRQNEALERQLSISTIKQTVLDWAAAWSMQDVEAYLSYYAGDFSPDDGRTLEQWRQYRRERVGAPGSIEVVVSDLVVDMLGDEHARATFTQVYQSPGYSDRVKKTLLLKQERNNWKITQEQTR